MAFVSMKKDAMETALQPFPRHLSFCVLLHLAPAISLIIHKFQ